MFFIAYAFKGHVHAFAGLVKVVSHSSCRTRAIFKYFCPLYWLAPLGKVCQGVLILKIYKSQTFGYVFDKMGSALNSSVHGLGIDRLPKVKYFYSMKYCSEVFRTSLYVWYLQY